MAASLKDKRTPITTPPYQVPSVDVIPDPPIFSLVTTFKSNFIGTFVRKIGLKIHLIIFHFEELSSKAFGQTIKRRTKKV
jgi:hypothetical protein